MKHRRDLCHRWDESTRLRWTMVDQSSVEPWPPFSRSPWHSSYMWTYWWKCWTRHYIRLFHGTTFGLVHGNLDILSPWNTFFSCDTCISHTLLVIFATSRASSIWISALLFFSWTLWLLLIRCFSPIVFVSVWQWQHSLRMCPTVSWHLALWAWVLDHELSQKHLKSGRKMSAFGSKESQKTVWDDSASRFDEFRNCKQKDITNSIRELCRVRA